MISCSLEGLYKTLVHHMNAYSSSGWVRSNLLIIPSTEQAMKHFGYDGLNCIEVIYPLKLSWNSARCFIFLMSQNTSFDVCAAHKMFSLTSSTLNYDPGSKDNKNCTLELVNQLACTSIPQSHCEVITARNQYVVALLHTIDSFLMQVLAKLCECRLPNIKDGQTEISQWYKDLLFVLIESSGFGIQFGKGLETRLIKMSYL